jgi:uncharacterized phage protein gp47/JayE
MKTHLQETFIDTASEEFLDIHAEERSVTRLPADSIATVSSKN